MKKQNLPKLPESVEFKNLCWDDQVQTWVLYGETIETVQKFIWDGVASTYSSRYVLLKENLI